MNAIKVVENTFKNNSVRAFEESGIAWFVAGDISKALGYAQAKDMTRMLDEDEKGRRLVPTRSGNQEMVTINESGMYHALIKSRKPEAKPFRKWVTGEVLPSIRKTGSYTLPSTLTPAQQRSIQEAVAELSKEDGSYAKHYGNLKTHFRVGTYKDIPVEKFEDAMSYLIGEWIPEEPQGIDVNMTNLKCVTSNARAVAKYYPELYEMRKEMERVALDVAQLSEHLSRFHSKTVDHVRDGSCAAAMVINKSGSKRRLV